MHVLNPRAGRRSLAYAVAILSTTAILGACSDETTAPTPNAQSRAVRSEALAPSPYEVKVDLSILDKRVTFNTSTGYASVRAAVSCTVNEMFDVVLEMSRARRKLQVTES
jgi:hypothetical protein